MAGRLSELAARVRGVWVSRPELLAVMTIIPLLAGAVVLWWERRVEASVNPATVRFTAIDDYLYYYPTARYAFGELRAGRFPLWSPYQHAGVPFFATAQHGILYPLNLPYLLLDTAVAEKLAALLHLTLAGLGAALLGRAWRQSWPAAVTTGVAFALAPPVTVLVYLPHHLYAVAWMPWQVLLLHRVLTSPTPWRWGLLLGACTGLQYLGGYPQFCLMSAYVLGAYLCWHEWSAWRTTAGRRHLAAAGRALVAGTVLALSMSAPQLLPNWELAQRSVRGVTALTIEQAGLQSADPLTSVLRALLPMHDVESVLPSICTGLPLFVLAGLGVVSSWSSTGAGFFLGLTVVTWVLAWGTHTALFRVFYHLPGGAAFRVPARFFVVTAMGLAVLVGAGVDALWRDRIARRRLRVLAWSSLPLAAVLLMVGWLVPLPDHLDRAGIRPPPLPSFDPAERAPALVTALAWRFLATGGWLFCYLRVDRRPRRVLVLTLPLLVYATLFVATTNTSPFPVTHPDLHTMPTRAVQFLRSVQGLDRTYVVHAPWPMPGHHLPARSGALYGLYGLNDRENVHSKRFADFVALMVPPVAPRARETLRTLFGLAPEIPQGEVRVSAVSPNLRLLDLLGTRYIVEGAGSDFRRDAAPGRFVPVFDADGVRIAVNLASYPRVFLVHRAEVVATPASVLERLVSREVDLRTTAILEREPAVPLPAGSIVPAGTAQIVHYAHDEVVIDVTAPATGILVLTDQHYPGWDVEVDGRPGEILVTDYLFRGVAVEAGAHQVVFRFVARSFRLGLEVAALGAMAVVAATLVMYRRR